ncbi:MAG: type II toxin-antitoxin system RelE/ParE family toxin [Planctomycetaceae bacterium]|nr:type II toxin-antitoxin system RelE/ParE family toxin [Planctomycetaceae bacterium]
MAAVVRTLLAEADLADILADLEQKNPAAADRYAARFEDKARLLANFPEGGRLRPEVAPDVRSTLVKPYVIFYRYCQETVQILRILHAQRDLRRIMEDESDN